jgi:hypothetical protein
LTALDQVEVGSDGSYGLRLPQVVIKRRTLPWERRVRIKVGNNWQNEDEKIPWLALVVIADGEGEILRNVPVAEAVTAHRRHEGTPDVPVCTTLSIRQSILEQVFPAQKDIPLLAHAREVDITDTELMMGDDDGFLSVVVANRLPVSGGKDANGLTIPVTYTACLISLEDQFDLLIKQAPAPQENSGFFDHMLDVFLPPALYDHVAGGEGPGGWADPVVNPADLFPGGLAGYEALDMLRGRPGAAGGPLLDPRADPQADPLAAGVSTAVASMRPSMEGVTATYQAATGYGMPVEKVAEWDRKPSGLVLAEPLYRFPVLLHWSFTSSGDHDFEALMQELDSGLLGTAPAGKVQVPGLAQPEPVGGRPPLEVIETGHVALDHRTRRGDLVRSWYRGPLLPHPSSGERIGLAHASDQLRAVVPDGREDVSLATAFEIGRLLALSRPSIVSTMMRWRQNHYQQARSTALWRSLKDSIVFDDLLDKFEGRIPMIEWRRLVEHELRVHITDKPDEMLGMYRPLITPGDPIIQQDNPLEVLALGLSLGVRLSDGFTSAEAIAKVADEITRRPVPVVDAIRFGRTIDDEALGLVLDGALNERTSLLMSNVIANEIAIDSTFGPTFERTPTIGQIIDRDPDITGAEITRIIDIPGGIMIRPDFPDPLDAILHPPKPSNPAKPSKPSKPSKPAKRSRS